MGIKKECGKAWKNTRRACAKGYKKIRKAAGKAGKELVKEVVNQGVTLNGGVNPAGKVHVGARIGKNEVLTIYDSPDKKNSNKKSKKSSKISLVEKPSLEKYVAGKLPQSNQREVPKLTPDREPELFNPIQKPVLVATIISMCTAFIPGAAQVVAVFDGALLYGYLAAKAQTPLIKTYFSDAEIAIDNYIKDKNRRGEQITDRDFEQKVEAEIDFAYERSMQIMDLGP